MAGLAALVAWREEITTAGALPLISGRRRQAYRYAAAAGDPYAVRALALWLGEQGRQAEADRIHRFGMDAYGRTVEADPH